MPPHSPDAEGCPSSVGTSADSAVARPVPGLRTVSACLLAGWLAACTSLPSAPPAPVVYDFGSTLREAAAQPLPQASRAPLVLAEIKASGVGAGEQAVQYRQTFAQDQRLRRYQQARWSQPPEQLLAQQLRQVLQAQRPVLAEDFNLARVRVGDAYPLVLQAELLAFEQVFSSPTDSTGYVQLRITLLEPHPQGDRLLAQQVLASSVPAHSPDAAGGVQALAQSADTIAQGVAQWLQSLETASP